MKYKFEGIKRKMNLQLFNGLFGPDGPPEGTVNPILDDSVENDSTLDNNDIDISKEDIDTEKDQVKTSTDQNIGDQNIGSINFDDMTSKLDAILNKINQGTTNNEVPDVEENKELTPEEIEKMNNDFYLKFTEKPLEALEELIEERANKKIEPLLNHFKQVQEMERWNNVISEFEKSNPDFRDHIEDISKIISEDEGIRTSKNPLEVAYKLVKAEKLEKELNEKNKPLTEIVKNQDTLKELLSNQEIKNLVIQELMKNKESIPTVIGSDGNTSINVGDRPKSLKEASKAWLGN